MKNAIIALLVIIIIALGIYVFTKDSTKTTIAPDDESQDETTMEDDQAMEEETEPEYATKTIIGSSVENQDIAAYHFGNGEKEILIVGGIHGGYSWNTSLLSFDLIDYFGANESVIPDGVKVTVVPVLNPDGLKKIVGTADKFSAEDVPDADTVPGRFNANNVDLNRNFGCDWQAEAVWRNTPVSGGSDVFSEPEAIAIRDYIEKVNPVAVVVYYSAGGGVFASNCHTGVLPETNELTDLYAESSGYKAFQSFDFYEITGDMVNWLARNEVPAISVLLTDHTNPEIEKNRSGVEAIINYYAN